MAKANVCEIIPWQELERMLDEQEHFSPALAARLWEATWADDKVVRPAAGDANGPTTRPPFPFVKYETGENMMPDGKTVVDEKTANVFASRLMTALRSVMNKGLDSTDRTSKEVDELLAMRKCMDDTKQAQKREKRKRHKTNLRIRRKLGGNFVWTKIPEGFLPEMYSEC